MANLPLEMHPDARVDALEAYDWYAERSIEAADAFRKELQDAGRAIHNAPERWATYLSGTPWLVEEANHENQVDADFAREELARQERVLDKVYARIVELRMIQ